MRLFKVSTYVFLALACLMLTSCVPGDSGDTSQNLEGGSAEENGGSTATSAESFEFSASDFTLPKGAANGPGTLGPWNKRLLVATSKDGNRFSPTGQIVTDQGDVPDLLTTDNGSVFLYYTGWTIGFEKNRTIVAISYDDGISWVFKKLDLDGFENMSTPVDPDIIYDNGVFRIFLTSDSGNGPKTYYAEGTDGVHFEKKGIAFEVEDQPVLDPSVIKINDTWHLFAGGVAGKNWHATSQAGQSFELDKLIDFEIEKNRHYQFSNGLNTPKKNIFLAYSDDTIRSFRSNDGEKWELEFNNEFPAGADPAITILENGTFLMVYTSKIQ